MNIIVKVCLSDFKAKWITGSLQYKPVVCTNGLLTNTHTYNTLTICLTSYTVLLPLSHNPRLQSALNKLWVCVFFFFFLSAEHPHYRMPQRWADSGIHLHIPYLYSSSSWFNFSFLLLFSFLLSFHCVAIYPHIIKFLILLALVHMHTHIHKLSHILQCKWNMCTYKSTSGYAWGIEGVFLVVYIKSSILVLL